MHPPPYQQPGASAAFWVLFGGFALGEYLMRFRSWRNRGGTRTERWSLLVVAASAAVALLIAFTLSDRGAGSVTAGAWPLFTLGLALMAAGIIVRQWAIVSLGRFFTADVRVHAGQTVVDTGPYRWVRHPSYSGLVLFFVGTGLALGNWLSAAVLAIVPAAGLVVRIHAEERSLEEGLGEPYRRFAASRRRLIPGIW